MKVHEQWILRLKGAEYAATRGMSTGTDYLYAWVRYLISVRLKSRMFWLGVCEEIAFKLGQKEDSE